MNEKIREIDKDHNDYDMFSRRIAFLIFDVYI
jgi:hypothetical protein